MTGPIIRDRRAFASGALFLAFAVFFFVTALNYPAGTAARRCHANLRWMQRCGRDQFSGNDCDGFPFRHRPEAMKVRGQSRAMGTGRNEMIAEGGESRDELL
jgi:hypothetical protein